MSKTKHITHGMMRRITSVVFATAFIVSGTISAGQAPISKAAGIKLSKNKLTMTVGDVKTLKVSGTKKKVTWKVADKGVVKFSKKSKLSAKIIAKKAGKTTVSATVGKKTLKCKVTVKTKTEPKKLPYKKIIIDTDTGADDSSAIILAAAAKSADILGVTTLVGNAGLDQSTKNALMALEIAGSDAPVYAGADKTYDGTTIEAFSVYGKDGMGDKDLVHPKGKKQDQDAVDFILETINKYPNEVEIVALGPATNIANAIKKESETMKKVKMIWSMGTAGRGPGNASPVAEFNTCHDALAYKAMLDSGIPVTVVGLDMCLGDSQWTEAQFDALSKTCNIGKFVSDSFTKLREFYAGNGLTATANCDSVAMMACLDPDFIRSSTTAHGSCITDRNLENFGQVIFYEKGFTYDVVKNDFENYNVTLLTGVDSNGYFNAYKNIIASVK